MKRPLNRISPDQAIALCSPEQAGKLVSYDQHVVRVHGRDGVMLTRDWMPLEQHAGPFLLTVVFHGSEEHPRAPGEIQAIVDELTFQVRGQPR